MKHSFLKCLYLITILLNSTTVLSTIANESVKLLTPQIVQATLSGIPSCLKYKVIGLCFWKVCAGPYCWIEETLKVDQYLPDAVVTVYRQTDSDPWDFAKTIVDPAAKQVGQAQTSNSRSLLKAL
jgi:hypothetical protein